MNQVKLPDSMAPLKMAQSLEMNKFLSLTDLTIMGSNKEFDFEFDELKSELGELHLPDAMRLNWDSDMLKIFPSKNHLGKLLISEFQLGRFLNEDLLGNLSGSIEPIIEISTDGDVSFKIENSDISNFGFNGYDVSQIEILGRVI